jgi:hypothetical protein
MFVCIMGYFTRKAFPCKQLPREAQQSQKLPLEKLYSQNKHDDLHHLGTNLKSQNTT